METMESLKVEDSTRRPHPKLDVRILLFILVFFLSLVSLWLKESGYFYYFSVGLQESAVIEKHGTPMYEGDDGKSLFYYSGILNLVELRLDDNRRVVEVNISAAEQ